MIKTVQSTQKGVQGQGLHQRWGVGWECILIIFGKRKKPKANGRFFKTRIDLTHTYPKQTCILTPKVLLILATVYLFQYLKLTKTLF